uniref:Allatotropin variant B n=1 Tax=Lygus hesperus TaxID=30085 RepID=A0A0K8S3I6_LYGHE|nr:allatotropin precursor variant B [Lygus hesperus]
MQWVRTSVCLIVLIALMYETVHASAPQMLISRYYDRSRSTRGLKNGPLNSARGFGKRSPHTSEETNVPIEWMADEMASNPELARLMVRQFIDVDRDGFLSPYELLSRPGQSCDQTDN